MEGQTGLFSKQALFPENEKWEMAIQRYRVLEPRKDDIRSEFLRDYNRIIHSKAFRRLKHKTQVFFATTNDHICTRMEHVTHVASVSENIAHYLGLNTELTRAIAVGHDLGHAPFGHKGEKILATIAEQKLEEKFWHEKNSLVFIDQLEMLADENGIKQNLSLTYAVRDGIISHCGEVDENGLFPRNQAIDLYDIQNPNEFAPYSWEGCVVKVSDKISYLGRDIEDALTLKILDKEQLKKLKMIVEKITDVNLSAISNTMLMHGFIINLCATSSPENGIRFSDNLCKLINEIKNFNYEHIYNHPRLIHFHRYAEVIINSIFEILANAYKKSETPEEIKKMAELYPELSSSFLDWISTYAESDAYQVRLYETGNVKVYNLDSQADYLKAIIHYISSMTDHFILRIYGEITKF